MVIGLGIFNELSVKRMQSPCVEVSAEVSMERVPIHNSNEPLNVMTGVFLKSVHFLNSVATKCVVDGLFKDRATSRGVLIALVKRKNVLFNLNRIYISRLVVYLGGNTFTYLMAYILSH